MDVEKLATEACAEFIDDLSEQERNFLGGVSMVRSLVTRALLHGMQTGLDIAKAACKEDPE